MERVEKVEAPGFIIVRVSDGENEMLHKLFDLEHPNGRRLAKMYQNLQKQPKKRLFKLFKIKL